VVPIGQQGSMPYLLIRVGDLRVIAESESPAYIATM
jgi:hypothetical protein